MLVVAVRFILSSVACQNLSLSDIIALYIRYKNLVIAYFSFCPSDHCAIVIVHITFNICHKLQTTLLLFT